MQITEIIMFLILSILRIQKAFANLTSSVTATKFLRESCPYKTTCLDSCYICEDLISTSSCSDDSIVLNCAKYKPICPNSELNKKSGSKTFKIHPKSFCIYELDLRSSISQDDSIRFNFKSSPPISITKSTNSITIISYKDNQIKSKPSRIYSSSTIYRITDDSVLVTGNYLLIVCWYNDDKTILLDIEWKVVDSDKENFDNLLLATLIPCIGLCCIILCIYSYCRRRYNRISGQVRYEIVNRDDLFEDSFIDSVLPIRYYLVKGDDMCPICFEYFSIGHQVRQTRCQHLFHSSCLEEWIESKPSRYLCPICKSELFDFQVIN